MNKTIIKILLSGLITINTVQGFDFGKAIGSGGNVNINSIANGAGLDLSSLSSLGLDGLNINEIINLDLGGFAGALSLECDFPTKLPRFQLPIDICSEFGGFSFNQTLDLGKCKLGVGASSSGIGKNFNGILDDYCSKIIDSDRIWSQVDISSVFQQEQLPSSVDSEAPDISVNSKFLKPKQIKFVNESYKYLRGSDIYNPDGVIGFDRIYKHDKDIPLPLISAFNKDNYTKFRIYDRFAKTMKPSQRNGKSGKDSVFIDFGKLKIEPSSYSQYKSDLELATKVLIGSSATSYVVEKKMKVEVDRIKKNIGKPQGSSSVKMKADYITKKGKMLKELFSLEIVKDSNGNDKNGHSELAKAMRDLKNYEKLKFAENEEFYKRSNPYIVRPSNLKVLTKRKENQLSYMDKMIWQQQQEARRKAENERMIKEKQEVLKLLAHKVFISNLEYNSAIAQKEIDEILGR